MNTDQSSSTPGRRVHWVDNTLTQDGWQIRYVSQGASLRCVPTVQANSTQTCWLASVRHSRRKLEDTRIKRPLNSMLKMLQRGVAPPIHPDSERILLKSLGHQDIKNSMLPDDISPVISEEIEGLDFAENLISRTPYEFCKDLTDSDRETEFVEWFNSNVPWATPWLVPQPSLEQMISENARDKDGNRRCDFLITIPGQENFVVEIDGAQHESQTQVDAERDASLLKSGISTIRVRVNELDSGTGPGLNEILNRVARAKPTFTIDQYVWAPIQLHRLMLAICEAVKVGFLNGPSWCISVSDPTKSSAILLGPYLRLLNAIYNLWGLGDYFPNTVTVYDNNVWYQYSQDTDWECSKGYEAEKLDVQINLECDHSPFETLPPVNSNDVPAIVIRSTGLQFQITNTVESGPERAFINENESSEDDFAEILQAIFAKKALREGQCEALLEILAGRDLTVLLPTGAGKSLIYQLAGLLLPGCTLIVDPIIALIEDQLRVLELYGIDKAIGISSNTTSRGKTKELLQRIGRGEEYFVFITPERFQMQDFRDTISQMVQFTPVNLVTIDEAHCISEWGHDFRTSYLTLGSVARSTSKSLDGSPPPLLALTGTASRVVLKDVLFQLGMNRENNHSVIQPNSFDRPELSFEIRHLKSESSEAGLAGIIQGLPSRFDESYTDFFKPSGDGTYSGLIFVPTVNGHHGIDETVEIIKKIIGEVGFYSGGAPRSISDRRIWDELKREMANKFISNGFPVLVTTKAFGMGIDKPNIRWVIHYGLPSSIESYYQEVGRCGRDGRDALCIFILSEYDVERNRMLLSPGTADEHKVTRQEGDDVTTGLYFHHQNFPGIDDEVGDVVALAQEMNLLSRGNNNLYEVEIDFDSRGQQKERALHRLVLLGIISDYSKDYGGRKFVIKARKIASEDIVENFLEYIDRNQPGLRSKYEQGVLQNSPSFRSALESCTKGLITFVYETVKLARLRSLREVWLAAHQCRNGEEFRERILDYLTEGTAQKILEELIDQNIKISDWSQYWRGITSEEMGEWRGSAGRLLTSYPDNIGLLITRWLIDALDGRLTSRNEQYRSEDDISHALEKAKENNIPSEEIEKTLEDILLILRSRKRYSAIVALIEAIFNRSCKFNAISNYLKKYSGESEELKELHKELDTLDTLEHLTDNLLSATSISKQALSIHS